MYVQRTTEQEIRPDQVRAMAHGLYHLADIDGIKDTEKDLIKEFLRDGNVDLDVEGLARIPFSLEALTHSLDTVFLRKTFLKTCILLCRADGVCSDQELAELRRIAQMMAVDEPLDSLMAQLEGKSLV